MFIPDAWQCEACLQSTSGLCSAHQPFVTLLPVGRPTPWPFIQNPAGPSMAMGWKCPQCGNVHSPSVQTCPTCLVKTSVTVTWYRGYT
jgi:hypothetical protein